MLLLDHLCGQLLSKSMSALTIGAQKFIGLLPGDIIGASQQRAQTFCASRRKSSKSLPLPTQKWQAVSRAQEPGEHALN